MQTIIAMAANHRSRAYHGKGEISDSVIKSIEHEQKKKKVGHTARNDRSPYMSFVNDMVGY
jgi:hypothetical protein